MDHHGLRCGFAIPMLCAALLSVPGTQLAQAQAGKAWEILKAGLGDSNTERRAAATSVLGLMVNNADAQALARKGLSDEKPEVRAAAAGALGDMRAKGAIPELKNAIQDKDVSVVLAAAHALYVLKDPSGYEVYYAILTGQEKSGNSLIGEQKKTLSDPKKLEQLGVEGGLGLIPFAGLGLSALRAVTKDDASPARAAAAKLLATDPDERSGEALAQAALDKSWIVRVAALHAIAERGDVALELRVEGGMDDQQYQVRYAAAAAVLHLNDLKKARGSKPGK